MPISHDAAVARARKAAATRARNRAAHGEAPKAPNQKRLSIRKIRTASEAELRETFNAMNAPGWVWKQGDDTRYYRIKDELRYRTDPNLTLAMHREGIRDIGGHKVKPHAPGKPRKTRRTSIKVIRHGVRKERGKRGKK